MSATLEVPSDYSDYTVFFYCDAHLFCCLEGEGSAGPPVHPAPRWELSWDCSRPASVPETDIAFHHLQNGSRIHECRISLRFLGIILRVLTLKGFCLDLLDQREKGYGFLSGFPPFSFTVFSNWTVETVRGCVSLKKQKSEGKAVEVNSKEENC